MDVERGRRAKIFRAFQNSSVIIALIAGFWVYYLYKIEDISKNSALFLISIICLVLFGLELLISLIIKESVVQAGLVSQEKNPGQYNIAVTMKIVFCFVAVLGIIIYFPK